jgi:hypothetical protein
MYDHKSIQMLLKNKQWKKGIAHGYTTAQMVSRRPLITKAQGFTPGSARVGFVIHKVALGQAGGHNSGTWVSPHEQEHHQQRHCTSLHIAFYLELGSVLFLHRSVHHITRDFSKSCVLQMWCYHDSEDVDGGLLGCDAVILYVLTYVPQNSIRLQVPMLTSPHGITEKGNINNHVYCSNVKYFSCTSWQGVQGGVKRSSMRDIIASPSQISTSPSSGGPCYNKRGTDDWKWAE